MLTSAHCSHCANRSGNCVLVRIKDSGTLAKTGEAGSTKNKGKGEDHDSEMGELRLEGPDPQEAK